MKSLGCTIVDPNDPTTRVYVEKLNPALHRDVTSKTGLFRVIEQPIDNAQFATPEATAKIVAGLNAYLPHVDSASYYSVAPELVGEGGFGFRVFGFMEWSHPKQRIRRPDGELVAAGLIGYFLGDETQYGRERMRDWAIYEHLGIHPAPFVAESDAGNRRWLSDVLIDALQGAVA